MVRGSGTAIPLPLTPNLRFRMSDSLGWSLVISLAGGYAMIAQQNHPRHIEVPRHIDEPQQSIPYEATEFDFHQTVP